MAGDGGTAKTGDGFLSGSVFDIPCYSSSLMWGSATGTAAALHRYRANGFTLPVRAVDAGMKFFFVTSLASYYMCRTNFMDKVRAARYARARVFSLSSPISPCARAPAKQLNCSRQPLHITALHCMSPRGRSEVRRIRKKHSRR